VGSGVPGGRTSSASTFSTGFSLAAASVFSAADILVEARCEGRQQATSLISYLIQK